MKDFYLQAYHYQARKALRAQLEMPYEGLTDVETFHLLDNGLQAIHDSLQQSFDNFGPNRERQTLQVAMQEAYARLLRYLENGGSPDTSLIGLRDFLQSWLPKGGQS